MIWLIATIIIETMLLVVICGISTTNSKERAKKIFYLEKKVERLEKAKAKLEEELEDWINEAYDDVLIPKEDSED